ncbi:MAG TPA: hypothetical protein VJ842_19420 [Pyrinomonadaceae bacterium]|nr:hypothetical protein [Pyrinomonadaceae bacterium]
MPANTLPATPKEALEAFIIKIEKDRYRRYKHLTTKNQFFYFLFQWMSILAGFGTALIAALLKEEQFGDWGRGRILLVTLPIVGTLATTAFTQTRVYDRWKLRQQGFLAFQSLVNVGRQRFAEANGSVEEYCKIHKELIRMVDEIEAQQHTNFFATVTKSTEDPSHS